ncbi:hypothetical protein EIP91_000546 [Steccherinum ochraceum]|uniref:Mid2 domain-containing protein n=1 Tax=Steccherinum ochraceum TaxID=92696 RepID=A0A4V2MXQ5_9APHY|nr:hypothetical protein EIP91_000546 [Steccherinum ochraceum]
MGTGVWFLAWASFTLLDKSAILLGVAQTSNVTACIPEDTWMSNTSGQTPCLIAAWLYKPCSDGVSVSIDGHPGNTWSFAPPSGGSVSDWAQSISPIPNETSVPHWAYLDVTTSGTFNTTIAQADSMKDLPESTALPSTSTSTSPSDSATNTNTSSSPPPLNNSGSILPTNGPIAAPSSKHTETASIVGGVVGGIGGAAILCAAAFLFVRMYLRQKRSISAPGPALTDKDKPSAYYAESSVINSLSPVLIRTTQAPSPKLEIDPR